MCIRDRLIIAVYFGGDILSTMLNKLRRKPKQEDFFDFSQNAMTVSLSIDSIRQLCSGAVSYTHLKQLMAGAGVAVVGMVLVPLLSGLFTV